MSKIALNVVFNAEITMRCEHCAAVMKQAVEHCVDKTVLEYRCHICNERIKFQFRVQDAVEPAEPIFPDHRD